MMPALPAILLCLAVLPALAAADGVPEIDSAIGLNGVMERAAARSRTLDKLSERLEDLTARYASDEPVPAGERLSLRQETEAEERRLHQALSEYWHLAEAMRVMEAAGVVGRAIRNKAGTVDAGKAAELMDLPLFPTFIKSSRSRARHALDREERAFAAAVGRRARRKLERRLSAAAVILLLGTSVFAAIQRRGPCQELVTPLQRASGNEPPRLT